MVELRYRNRGLQFWINREDDVYRSAVISDDRVYRYSLARRWDGASRDSQILTWVMLNPSRADGATDDPTVRKCMGFARRWGFRSIRIVNLMAYRATRPIELMAAQDPRGPENLVYVSAALREATRVIVAWGDQGRHHPLDQILGLLRAHRSKVYCLGQTASGQPRHPCRLPYATPLVPWP